MFRELKPLLEKRTLSITVSALSDGRIRVNVVPQRLDQDGKINEKIGYANKEKIAAVPESAIEALTTPLSLTGTAEEIDENFSHALIHFTESHVALQNTLEQASRQIAEAVKAAQERDKSKTKPAASASGETKDEKKSGQDELLPLWCVPPRQTADADVEDKIVLPDPVAESPNEPGV
jgi:PRTRC genetic system protein E